MPRTWKATERISLGMEVVAVAVGVGYGVADTIVRRVQRHDDASRPPDVGALDRWAAPRPSSAAPGTHAN